METTNLLPMIDDLEGNIDELEKVLTPLLSTNLTDITSKLPLLDRAKLHVLVTYGIESILFSYLKLNGVDARNHPVFQELNRVKQYFAKIKEAEDGEAEKQPSLRLDKGAAGRFIKSALAGNDEYDRKRAEQQNEKPLNTHTRFEETSDQVGTAQRFKQMSKKRKAEEEGDASQPEPVSEGREQVTSSANEAKPAEEDNVDGSERKKKKNKKNKKKSRPLDEINDDEQDAKTELVLPPPEPVEQQKSTPEYNKKRAKKEKKQHKSHNVPKSGSEAFQQLLNKPSKAHKTQEEALEYG